MLKNIFHNVWYRQTAVECHNRKCNALGLAGAGPCSATVEHSSPSSPLPQPQLAVSGKIPSFIPFYSFSIPHKQHKKLSHTHTQTATV